MISLPGITLRDDRNRPVQLWRSRGDAASDSVPPDLRDRIAALLVDQHRGIRAQATIFIAVIMMGVAASFLAALGLWSPYLTGAAIPVVVFAVMFSRMWLARHRLTGAIRATLLAEGHCACCGYDLRGLTPDPDRCTRCPECSAAWRLNPALQVAVDRRTPRSDTGEIEQDRAARRQFSSALQGFGVRRRFSTVDASGRIVNVISPDPFAARPSSWAALDPHRQRRIRRRFRALGLGPRIAVGLTLFPVILFQAWQWLLAPIPSPLSDPLGLIGRVFGTLMLPLIYALFVFRPYVRRAEALADLMLDEGCCPSCATAIVDEPIDENGNFTCPHCHSAWDASKAIRAIRSSKPASSGLLTR